MNHSIFKEIRQLDDILLLLEYDVAIKTESHAPKYTVNLIPDGYYVELHYSRGKLFKVIYHQNNFIYELPKIYFPDLNVPLKIRISNDIIIEGLISNEFYKGLDFKDLINTTPYRYFYHIQNITFGSYYETIESLKFLGFETPLLFELKKNIEEVREYIEECRSYRINHYGRFQGVFIKKNIFENYHEATEFNWNACIYLWNDADEDLELVEHTIKKAGYEEPLVLPKLKEEEPTNKEEERKIEKIIEDVIKTAIEVPFIQEEKPIINERIVFNHDQQNIKHYVKKEAMDIKLDDETIVALTKINVLKQIPDLYSLKKHKNKILDLGVLSEDNLIKLLNAIEKSKKASHDQIMIALSIPISYEILNELQKHLNNLNELEKEQIIEQQQEKEINAELEEPIIEEVVELEELEIEKTLEEVELEPVIDLEEPQLELEEPVIELELEPEIVLAGLESALDLEEPIIEKEQELEEPLIELEEPELEEPLIELDEPELEKVIDESILAEKALEQQQLEEEQKQKEEQELMNQLEREELEQAEKEREELERQQEEQRLLEEQLEKERVEKQKQEELNKLKQLEEQKKLLEKKKQEELERKKKEEERKKKEQELLEKERIKQAVLMETARRFESFLDDFFKENTSENTPENKTYQQLAENYSTFQADTIGSILEQLVNAHEAEQYVYTEGYLQKVSKNLIFEPGMEKEKHMILKEGIKKQEKINMEQYQNAIKNRDLLYLGETEDSKEITFFKKGDKNQPNFLEFPYVKEFLTFVVKEKAKQYEFDPDVKPTYTEQELNQYLNQYLKQKNMKKGDLDRKQQAELKAELLRRAAQKQKEQQKQNNQEQQEQINQVGYDQDYEQERGRGSR